MIEDSLFVTGGHLPMRHRRKALVAQKTMMSSLTKSYSDNYLSPLDCIGESFKYYHNS